MEIMSNMLHFLIYGPFRNGAIDQIMRNGAEMSTITFVIHQQPCRLEGVVVLLTDYL